MLAAFLPMLFQLLPNRTGGPNAGKKRLLLVLVFLFFFLKRRKNYSAVMEMLLKMVIWFEKGLVMLLTCIGMD